MKVTRFYKNGALHREDGPAVVWYDDSSFPDDSDEPYEIEEWWINGSLIRCDLDYTFSRAASYWFKDDEISREDGPAVSFSDGYVEWRVNGELHRIGGPAVIWPTGTKEWWVNGKRHREDGPAVISGDGKCEWWVNGECVYSIDTIIRMKLSNWFDKITKLCGIER